MISSIESESIIDYRKLCNAILLGILGVFYSSVNTTTADGCRNTAYTIHMSCTFLSN